MKQRIVLLGPPASGKGSQARMISQKYGIPAVSTGHLLRDEALAGTKVGAEAAQFTSKGQLAPDELVMTVLQAWLDRGRKTFILDGFPRTIAQARLLEPVLASLNTPLEIVIALECQLPVIEDRVLNRVSCVSCERIFKMGESLDVAAVECPDCNGPLLRRSDDTPEVLALRMVQYAEKTKPLANFYQQRGLLHPVNAEAGISSVFAEIEDGLLS